MELTEKLCRRCGDLKPADDFNKDKAKPDGLAAYCRECWKELKRTKYRYPDKTHLYYVRYRYKVTPEEYDRLFKEQGGRCAICKRMAENTNGKGKRLHVDHCHDSKRIRALLCSSCNAVIGYARDDPKVLESAIRYLRRWPLRFSETHTER